MATRREAMGNLTRRWRATKVTRAVSVPLFRGSIVLPLSHCDSCRLSRCDDFSLVVRDSCDDLLPPRSFLRDKPSSCSGSLRNRRSACTRHPDAISVYQNYHAPHDNHNHPEIEKASPLASAGVSSSFPLANVILAAGAPAPAPRTSLPLEAITLALELACCRFEYKNIFNHRFNSSSALNLLPETVTEKYSKKSNLSNIS